METVQWASLIAQVVKNPPTMWKTLVQSLDWEDPRKKERLPTPVFWPGIPWTHTVAKSQTGLSDFHFQCKSIF